MSEVTEDIRYTTIERFPGYRFGSDGSVWTCLIRNGSVDYSPVGEWRLKKQTPTSNGYLMVTVRDKDGVIRRCVAVHRLILEAFIGPCPPGLECRHFPDGNKQNNNIRNLSWGSRSQNFMDKWDQNTMQHGECHARSKLTEEDVRQIRHMRSSGMTLKAIAAQFGVTYTAIQSIVTGGTWSWLK